MSWYAKVNWSEGLFLRPHHLQQADRYLENILESRTRHVTPYPWGFAMLETDRDLAQQSKFALRRTAGVMPDGTIFDFPADSPSPPPIEAPETAAGQLIWLAMPAKANNSREVSQGAADTAGGEGREPAAQRPPQSRRSPLEGRYRFACRVRQLSPRDLRA